MPINLNKLVLAEPPSVVIKEERNKFSLKSDGDFYEITLQSSEEISALEVFNYATSPDIIRFAICVNASTDEVRDHLNYRTRYGNETRIELTGTSLITSVLYTSMHPKRLQSGNWTVIEFEGTVKQSYLQTIISEQILLDEARNLITESISIFELSRRASHPRRGYDDECSFAEFFEHNSHSAIWASEPPITEPMQPCFLTNPTAAIPSPISTFAPFFKVHNAFFAE